MLRVFQYVHVWETYSDKLNDKRKWHVHQNTKAFVLRSSGSSDWGEGAEKHQILCEPPLVAIFLCLISQDLGGGGGMPTEVCNTT